ncbi:hypothetical protein D7Y13_37230 [Corallococcus praedator]|uniref:Uncharacterized protein n=2 Tax=Myxococcaceae TaxID=31 RepID=A0ABX9Q5S1_9BACT|nr:hypothetical protein D7X74_09400 [Corallococcus sp. CA047B]RKH23809.1 hypothetical protein D7X75_33010 [Corallococcus sp. CA031C]RKH92320.1 hypothetical protein D7Y13_37230 [Corallococcus praedator]
MTGMSIQDTATWIAFNLPVGTVVTMTDAYVAPADGNVYNLKGCGKVIDLVGTGKTEAVDLVAYTMNDMISAWYWHTPDLNLGAIELYAAGDFQWNRTVLFLSEWNAGQLHSLTGWHVEDSASSARWQSMHDAQTASLYAADDGSGAAYENIKGWGSFMELRDFGQVGFNDTLSSFRWNNLTPRKEIVAPVRIAVPSGGGEGLSSYLTGTNDSSEVQPFTITLTNTNKQTTTVSVTNQYTAGTNMQYTLTHAKEGLGSDLTNEWTVGLGFEYTNTETSEMSRSQTTALSVSQTFNVPPYTVFNATLLVMLGQLPPSSFYTTTAERWYDQNLKGSTFDPSNGWWKRTESISLHLGGTLAAGSNLTVTTTKLPVP